MLLFSLPEDVFHIVIAKKKKKKKQAGGGRVLCEQVAKCISPVSPFEMYNSSPEVTSHNLWLCHQILMQQS